MIWFDVLTGFSEQSGDDVRSKLHLDGTRLNSSVNNRSFDAGTFSTPSLSALRRNTVPGDGNHTDTPEIPQIANEIMSSGVLPAKAQVDALHIAAVAHHRIQYLLTWNCKHIANAKILPRIHDVLNELAIPIPIICTPEELLGNDTEED